MMTFRRQLQRGFSLITAIFLLVVLGTLGSMMVTFFATQQQSGALDVMGARAYQAARAGIEWASLNVSITPQGTPWAGCTPVSSPLGALPGNLSPFTVTLNCTMTGPVVEGTSTIYTYNITSTAVAGGAAGNSDYVERQISVALGR